MQITIYIRYGLSLLLFHVITATLCAQTVLKMSNADSIQENLKLAEIKEQENDLRGASDCLNKAALIESEHRNYEQAIVYYEKSLALNQRLNNTTGIAGIHSNLAMLHNDLGQYSKALDYFQKTLASRKARNEQEGIFDALFNIGMVLKNLNRIDEAITSLEGALNISKEGYDYRKMRLCYGTLYEFYEKKGNAEKMRYYFEFYKAFNEQVYKSERNKLQTQVKQAETKTREIELEKKIALLEKDREIKIKDQEIAKATTDKKFLFSQLSEDQKIIQLLEQDKRLLAQEKELEEAKNYKQKTENELIVRDARYKNNLLFYGFIALIVMAGLLIFAFIVNTARQRANEALKKKQFDLAQANRIKDKMFSIIAHDLRTPFNGIKGLFMLLEQDLLDEEEKKYLLQQLQVTTDSTIETLENLLNWAENQIQGAIAKPQVINLYGIAMSSFKLLNEPARQKNITLSNDLPTDEDIVVDPEHFNVILRNLISNAIKFTPFNGSVNVEAKEEQGFWRISVHDSGVGIPAERLALLFETDSHFSTRGTNNEKGSGLGLLLVKELVEKNNGMLTVESEIGKGTIFHFTLQAHQEVRTVLELDLVEESVE